MRLWPSRSSTVRGWWHLLALATVVDVEVRRRPNGQMLAGGLDWWIAIELGLSLVIGLQILSRLAPPRLDSPIAVCVVGYCASTAISAIYAPTPALAFARGGQILVLLAGTLELARQIADHGVAVVHRWLHGLIAVTTALVAIGVTERLVLPERRSARFSWLATHSVLAGALVAICVVVTYGMWLARPTCDLPWRRSTYLSLLVVHSSALVLTRTRGSIAAAIAAIAVMSLWWVGARRHDLVVLAVIAAVGLGLTAAGPIVGYLMRSATASELSTLNNRTDVWRLAWQLIRERPVMGHGLTASRSAFIDDTGLGGAHNAYLNVLVDVGLVGFGWWALVIALTATTVFARVRMHASLPPAARNHGAGSFCLVTATGLLTCQLINALSAEWLGVGVGTSATVLFVTGLWVRTVTDPSASRS